MKVPLVDLRAQLQTIEANLKAAVLEVLDSARYIMGPKVEELERRIADYVGARHGVGVSSGRDALLISLMALGVRSGDLIITTPYSFFATAGVTARLNVTPVFVNIDPDSYNIDSAELRAWFDRAGDEARCVKAIMLVHLYGQCADMPAILETGRQYDTPAAEDAGQAIGANCPTKDGLRKAGTFGEVGSFSRNHGAQPEYYHEFVGGNFRLDPMQAATLPVRLPQLENWHAAWHRNAVYYDDYFDIAGVKEPTLIHGRSNHIYNQYIISVPRDRDGLRTLPGDNQIGTQVYYLVLFHKQECFAQLGYSAGDFPRAEHAAEHTVALPTYPELTTAMQDHVIAKIGEFYGH